MKPKIHPQYEQTTITCACGAVYHVGSTKKNIKVDICAKCHPFFTGVQKIIDTGGRVERFRQKYGYIAGETKPEDAAKVEQAKSAPAPVRVEQVKADQSKSGQAKAGQSKAGQAKVGQATKAKR